MNADVVRPGPGGGTGLRTGWTTGACATAATRAAYPALLTGEFPDPVTITLPKGQTPAFALTRQRLDGARTAGTGVSASANNRQAAFGIAPVGESATRPNPGR